MANFPGGPRYASTSFTIGDKAYVGLGVLSDTSLQDFWQYTPANKKWIRKKDFPGGARVAAVAFTISGKGYVGTGQTNTTAGVEDFWEYDPSTDSWTKKADFPGGG